jgi:hypothetical protein
MKRYMLFIGAPYEGEGAHDFFEDFDSLEEAAEVALMQSSGGWYHIFDTETKSIVMEG